MNAIPFPPPRPEGEILSRVYPTMGQPLPMVAWRDFRESFEFYAEAVTTGEILVDDVAMAEIDSIVIDAVDAMQAGASAISLGKVGDKDLAARSLHSPEAFRAESGLHFVLADLEGVGRSLAIYRGGLDGHYLRSATMFTINVLDDDPEGMRGLVPVGHVHLYAGPETRPFRTPILIAEECPERVVLGFLQSVVQLKMLADEGAPRRSIRLRPPKNIRRGEIVLASREGWVLTGKMPANGKGWMGVRLYRTQSSPKAKFYLGFNPHENRLARSNDLAVLEEHYPDIRDWAFDRVSEWHTLFAA